MKVIYYVLSHILCNIINQHKLTKKALQPCRHNKSLPNYQKDITPKSNPKPKSNDIQLLWDLKTLRRN